MKKYIAKFLKTSKPSTSPLAVRKRRLSVSLEEDAVLPGSQPGESCALTQAGVEFSRLKVNQDTYFVNEDRMIFAVFDGHGRAGHHCSKFVKENLSLELTKRPLTKEQLCDALVVVGDRLRDDAEIDSDFSGTTVLAVMVSTESVVSAWLGDSRAVMGTLGESTLRVVELSKDHKPEVPAERRRITKAGGIVKQLKDENGRKCGPLRVFKPSSTVPGVNFSRSMGDEVIHRYGVSAEVECLVQPRRPNDRFIVVASDGIFEFMDNLEVAETVYKCADVRQAAQSLLDKSRKRWMEAEFASDDLTVIVIKLN